MRRLLEDEAEQFLAALRQERVYGLRINTLKLEPATWMKCSPFPLEPVPWCRSGFYVPPDSRPGRHPYHAAGLYYIQEPSAMAAAEMLDVRPGETVLDLAAAPGGKATQLGAALQGKGLLVANEIHPFRAAVLAENVERFGIPNALVMNERPERLAERFPAFFDKILVDAPCSGEGMFRKDPQAVTEWSPEHVAGCARRQDAILDEAAKMLKPGGKLLYSTCTFAPEENEGTIARFLKRHRNFELVRHPLAALFAPGRPPWGDGQARLADCVRIWPHQVQGEGHFIALLVKTEEGASDFDVPVPAADGRRKRNRQRAFQSHRRPQRNSVAASRQPEAGRLWREFVRQHFHRDAEDEVASAVHEAAERLRIRNDQLFLLPASVDPSLASRLEGLRVLRPGLHLATLKKQRLEPAHALALALSAKAVVQTVELALDADVPQGAVRYLRGESLPLEDACVSGWVLLTVGGFPLGWGKASDGQIKNHYPKGLRWLGSGGTSVES